MRSVLGTLLKSCYSAELYRDIGRGSVSFALTSKVLLVAAVLYAVLGHFSLLQEAYAVDIPTELVAMVENLPPNFILTTGPNGIRVEPPPPIAIAMPRWLHRRLGIKNAVVFVGKEYYDIEDATLLDRLDALFIVGPTFFYYQELLFTIEEDPSWLLVTMESVLDPGDDEIVHARWDAEGMRALAQSIRKHPFCQSGALQGAVMGVVTSAILCTVLFLTGWAVITCLAVGALTARMVLPDRPVTVRRLLQMTMHMEVPFYFIDWLFPIPLALALRVLSTLVAVSLVFPNVAERGDREDEEGDNRGPRGDRPAAQPPPPPRRDVPAHTPTAAAFAPFPPPGAPPTFAFPPGITAFPPFPAAAAPSPFAPFLPPPPPPPMGHPNQLAQLAWAQVAAQYNIIPPSPMLPLGMPPLPPQQPPPQAPSQG